MKKKLFLMGAAVLLLLALGSVIPKARLAVREQSRAAIRDAVLRSAVQCYAVEGVYPPSLDYLEDNYALVVNHEAYIVSYESFASNQLPNVQVLVRGEGVTVGNRNAHLWLDTLLILGLLTLVAAGAGLYRSTVEAQRLHAQQRSALAYVQSQAQVCRVGVEAGEEADTLLLTQDGYETRIYLYENTLRSQLVPVGAKMAPENGDVICPLTTFRLTQTGNLLEVDTDMGRAWIHCFGGGGHG